MTRSAAQLDTDIAETLRAKKWQEQIDREEWYEIHSLPKC